MSSSAEQHERPSRWVTFSLARERYGIDVMHVQEIVAVPEILPVPGTPELLLGVIAWRDEVVTVIDLRRALRLGAEQRPARIIVVDTDGARLGLAVDDVADIIDLAPERIEAPPSLGPDHARAALSGVHHDGQRSLFLLDPGQLLRLGQRAFEPDPTAV